MDVFSLSPLSLLLIIVFIALLLLLLHILRIRLGTKVFSAEYSGVILFGKPDLLKKQGNIWIPVEFKSRKKPQRIYESHLLQLYSYILILQKNGYRVPYGILQYLDKRVIVKETAYLKNRLSEIISGIKEFYHSGKMHRNHRHTNKCKKCEFEPLCPESLLQDRR